MAAWDMVIRALDTILTEDTEDTEDTGGTTLTHTGGTIRTEGTTDTTTDSIRTAADTIPILVTAIGPGTTTKEAAR